MRTGFRAALGLSVVLAAGVCPAWASFTKPWDDLVADPNANWIDPYSINMYAANNANAYRVMFSTARPDGGARGMNSLRFVDTADAHHVSTAMTGSVNVLATGGQAFSSVLVLVAIDVASLPAGFGLTMNGYACDPQADFCYYDGAAHAAGRPGGYYPATSPAYEPIAYNFNRGMVTVLAFTPDTPLDPTHPFTLNYSFADLPAPAVFSVYGWPDGGTEIYHTNRGLLDNSVASTVSTFEVLPKPGDANGDGVVGAADYIILKQHFGAGTGAGAYEGDFDYDGDVDWGDLQILTGNFGARGGTPKAIPEPASLALLACGFAALPRRRRR
jgi:hypothetical protein